MFVHNFDSGLNVCEENFCGKFFFVGSFHADREIIPKNRKK